MVRTGGHRVGTHGGSERAVEAAVRDYLARRLRRFGPGIVLAGVLALVLALVPPGGSGRGRLAGAGSSGTGQTGGGTVSNGAAGVPGAGGGATSAGSGGEGLVCMYLGGIIASGAPGAVLSDPGVISSYLGDSPESIARLGEAASGPARRSGHGQRRPGRPLVPTKSGRGWPGI